MNVTTRITPDLAVPAPTTGIHLGTLRSGSFSIRLFRPSGTRIVTVGSDYAAMLITLRAAAAGVPVRIVTERAPVWARMTRVGPDVQVVPHGASTAHMGSALIIDDRPEPRGLAEVGDWQCLLDVRTPAPQQEADPRYVSAFAHADLAVFGLVGPQLARSAAAVFDLGEAGGALTVVPTHGFAVVTRGNVEIVRADATNAELAALR